LRIFISKDNSFWDRMVIKYDYPGLRSRARRWGVLGALNWGKVALA
jgi:hypothetical protein